MSKNHSVNKEKSYFARRRHRKGQHKMAMGCKRRRTCKMFFALFWSGEVKTFDEIWRMMGLT